MQNTSKRETIKIFLIFALSVIAMFVALYFSLTTKGTKTYDCSISEISPDYPLEVKEGCRKLRLDSLKK